MMTDFEAELIKYTTVRAVAEDVQTNADFVARFGKAMYLKALNSELEYWTETEMADSVDMENTPSQNYQIQRLENKIQALIVKEGNP